MGEYISENRLIVNLLNEVEEILKNLCKKFKLEEQVKADEFLFDLQNKLAKGADLYKTAVVPLEMGKYSVVFDKVGEGVLHGLDIYVLLLDRLLDEAIWLHEDEMEKMLNSLEKIGETISAIKERIVRITKLERKT